MQSTSIRLPNARATSVFINYLRPGIKHLHICWITFCCIVLYSIVRSLTIRLNVLILQFYTVITVRNVCHCEKVMFSKRVSKILSTGGCVCIPACTAVDTLLPPPNACWDTHPTGQTPHGQTPAHKQTPPWEDTILPSTYWETSPRADTPRQTPPPAATAAEGTHPTGMHSCITSFFYYLYRFRKC